MCRPRAGVVIHGFSNSIYLIFENSYILDIKKSYKKQHLASFVVRKEERERLIVGFIEHLLNTHGCC